MKKFILIGLLMCGGCYDSSPIDTDFAVLADTDFKPVSQDTDTEFSVDSGLDTEIINGAAYCGIRTYSNCETKAACKLLNEKICSVIVKPCYVYTLCDENGENCVIEALVKCEQDE